MDAVQIDDDVLIFKEKNQAQTNDTKPISTSLYLDRNIIMVLAFVLV